MGGSQVDHIKVVDRVLELLKEAFGWVKSRVEAFFKLLWNNLSAALLGVKSIVTICCQKLKQVLAGTNDLIDGGLQKLSEADAVVEKEKPKAPHEEDPEGSFVDELKKLLASTMKFVGFLKENGDPGWWPKVENLKGYLYVVEGFIELLSQIYRKQVVTVIVNLLQGYRIYKSDGTKQPAGALMRPQHQHNKAAYAIANVMSSVTSLVQMASASLPVSIIVVRE